jgi:hypothetical protein
MGDASIRVAIDMPMAGRGGIAVTVAIAAVTVVASGWRGVTTVSAAKAVAAAVATVIVVAAANVAAASAGAIRIGVSARQNAGTTVDRKARAARVIAGKHVEATAVAATVVAEMAVAATSVGTKAVTASAMTAIAVKATALRVIASRPVGLRMPVGWRLLIPTFAMTSEIALPIRRRRALLVRVQERLAAKARSSEAARLVVSGMASSAVADVVGVADAVAAEVERVKAGPRLTESVSRAAAAKTPSLAKVVVSTVAAR